MVAVMLGGQSCSLWATSSQMTWARAVLGPRGTSRTRPSADRITAWLSLAPKTAPPPTSLTTRRSQPLRASLARARSSTVPLWSPVSAAKPTTTCPGRPRRALSSARMSGVWVSSRLGAASPDFLILDSLTATGRKSAGAAAITTASADPAADTTASRSSSVVSTRTTLTPAESGSDTLAATRVTSAAGEVGPHHAAGQDVEADGEDLVGLGQPSLAGVGTGEAADRRLEDQRTAL